MVETATVDGREVVVLKSGRVVWKDVDHHAWGDWIASLRSWPVFGTFTYDVERFKAKQAATRRSLGYRDGLSDVVQRDTTIRHFEAWARSCSRLVGAPVQYVDAVEFHKSGYPHHHALLDWGPLRPGDFELLGGRWFNEHGFVRLEVPENQADVCRYAAKYLAKDLSRGEVLLSGGLKTVLAQRREYGNHGSPGAESYRSHG